MGGPALLRQADADRGGGLFEAFPGGFAHRATIFILGGSGARMALERFAALPAGVCFEGGHHV